MAIWLAPWLPVQASTQITSVGVSILGRDKRFFCPKRPVRLWAHSSACSVHAKCFYFPGVKPTAREVDHYRPSSAEVKNEWSYTPSPPICLHGVNVGRFVFLCVRREACKMSVGTVGVLVSTCQVPYNDYRKKTST